MAQSTKETSTTGAFVRQPNRFTARPEPEPGRYRLVVSLDGYDVATLSDRQLSALRARRIGFVFHQFHLAPGGDALGNVADGLLYTGAGKRERERCAEAALSRVVHESSPRKRHHSWRPMSFLQTEPGSGRCWVTGVHHAAMAAAARRARTRRT